MAPDVAKVDADRDLNLGLPAWNFSDGAAMASSWETSLSDPEDLLIPFAGTYSHHDMRLATWETGGVAALIVLQRI